MQVRLNDNLINKVSLINNKFYYLSNTNVGVKEKSLIKQIKKIKRRKKIEKERLRK